MYVVSGVSQRVPSFHDERTQVGYHPPQLIAVHALFGVEPDRMVKVFQRWTGWLRERPETIAYLARPDGSRAKTGG